MMEASVLVFLLIVLVVPTIFVQTKLKNFYEKDSGQFSNSISSHHDGPQDVSSLFDVW